MVDTPGPRRATRANSRAFSAAPTPVPQIRRAPRGAANRKGATPLPATGNAENNAYGSRGKVDLGSQQATNMSNDEFLRAFTSARDNAVVKVRATRTTQIQADSRQADENESDENDDEDDDNESDEQTEQDGDNDQNTQDDDRDDGQDDDESARSSRSASKAASSVRFSAEPPRRPARSAQKAPARRPTRSLEPDEDEDQPSALPRNLTRLRNNYDTSSPIAASSILQQRKNRTWSVTELNSGFSYEAPPQIQASSSRQPRRIPSRSRSREPINGRPGAVNPPATADEIRAANPRRFRVLLESIPRWWRQTPLWAKLAPLIAVLASLLLLMTGSTFLGAASRGAHLAARPFHVGSTWLSSVMSSNISIPAAISHKVADLQTSLAQLRSENAALRQALGKIEGMMPSAIMVRKDPVTGQSSIPDELLNALLDKLRKDKTLQSDHSSTASWDSWLESNKAHIANEVKAMATPAVREAILPYIPSGEILSKAQFMDLLEQTWSDFETKASQRMSSFESNLQRQMHRFASESSQSSHSKPLDTEHWILQNMIHNQELTLLKVNYFSHSMGAYADHSLSSPTYTLPTPWYRRLWLPEPHPNSHNMALSRWEEQFDCWCAAPSTTRGLAQLAVKMPVPILPDSVTIEHIPASGTTDIESAPSTFEIWVLAPHVQPPDPEAQARLVPECKSHPPPAAGYVCIGGGRYEIYSAGAEGMRVNHVQNFGLYAGGEVGLVTDVVVRVTGNWGREWTCLYRVRMHGVNREELEARERKDGLR